MAQYNRSDLARLERMERRLQALEDAEAIRNLKARYAAWCDNQYDADGIAMLFTEDALWESPVLGRFEGMVLPIEQRDVAIDLNRPVPGPTTNLLNLTHTTGIF